MPGHHASRSSLFYPFSLSLSPSLSLSFSRRTFVTVVIGSHARISATRRGPVQSSTQPTLGTVYAWTNQRHEMLHCILFSFYIYRVFATRRVSEKSFGRIFREQRNRRNFEKYTGLAVFFVRYSVNEIINNYRSLYNPSRGDADIWTNFYFFYISSMEHRRKKCSMAFF